MERQTKKERTTWTANTGGNETQVKTTTIKKERKQDSTGNTKADLTQEDKTTKIKQETVKSNPKP